MISAGYKSAYQQGYSDAMSDFRKEPKTGHWRAVYQGDEIINYRCSECELGDTNGSTNLYGWNFCPNCGARMVEPQEREEQPLSEELVEHYRKLAEHYDKRTN